MVERTHPASPATKQRVLERVVEMVSRVPILAIALVSGLAITVLVVLGVLQRAAYPLWGAANLDSEASVGTWFSAMLLWGAAIGWLLVAGTERSRLPALWIWWAVLAWLALDEGSAFHERLERWSGIDWQLLYLPLMAIAAASWWGVVRLHWTQRDTGVLLVVGAAAWASALLLELIQNWGGSPAKAAIYDPAMITEEALEMIGSTMVLMAAVLVVRRSTHTEPRGPSGPV